MVTVNDILDLRSFERYMAVRVAQKTASPETVTTYMSVLSAFNEWLGKREPNQELAQTFLDGLTMKGKSNSTVSTTAHAIRRWYRWKGRDIKLDYPSVKIGVPKYFSVEQMKELVTECVTPLERALVLVLFDTSARISEIMRVKLDDIDWDSGLIEVIGKGNKAGHVSMREESMAALVEWIACRRSKDSRVFMDMTAARARQVIKAVGERSGVHVTPHMFRHSRAVQMLLAGIPPHIVQQHLRHADIRTTLNIYGQLLPNDLKRQIPDMWQVGSN